MKKILAALALALCCMAGSFAYEAYVVGTDLHFDNVMGVDVYVKKTYAKSAGTETSDFYFMHWVLRLDDGTWWHVEGSGVATNAPINYRGDTDVFIEMEKKELKDLKDKKKKSK